MPDQIGPHLLGREPMPPDERDWKLARLLSENEIDEGDITLDSTLQEVLTGSGYFSSWQGILAFWRWLKSVVNTKPVPAPTPMPPTSVIWTKAEAALDQGNTGHCVGFGWAQWGNTLPVDDHFANADGHAIYYECKVIDGEPKQENGSNTRSGVKAMQNRGRVQSYAFAETTDTITAWLKSHGPVVVGTDWHNDMFSPRADGYITPTGSIAGGHEYDLVGFSSANTLLPNGVPAKADTYVMLNSWGIGWGINGYAYITVADFAKLLAADGDACGALEIAA